MSKLNLKNIAIVIVEPETPGNLGSIARACKNMGIGDIRLVNPCDYNVPDTLRLAHGANDIVEKFTTYPTLIEAIANLHVTIGTTNRHREKQAPLIPSTDMPKSIAPHTLTGKVGIIFGRESHGLSNEELERCNFQSTIITNVNHPAINLAQAVMIYAYECFQASAHNIVPYQWIPATKQDEQKLFEHIENVVPTLPINTRQGVKPFVRLFRRVLGRTCLERRDIRLFFKLFDLIKKKN